MTPWLDIANNAIDAYRAQQQAPELAVLLAFIDSTEPRSVLEIGSADGGLAWAIMQIASVSMLVTIDKTVTRGHQQVCDLFPARILAIYGDSTDEKIIHHAMAEGDYDVVIIDGGHDWRTASSDWNSYASMAKSGGLVVVHDTQGYHNFRDFDVPTMWATVRKRAKSVDLVSMPGVEAGTGIVWAGEGEWWDVL